VVVQQQAVVIVQLFAILLETFLILIFLLGVFLLQQCGRRLSNLKSDPSSLTHTMSITSESTSLLQQIRNFANQSGFDCMNHSLEDHRFGLRHWATGAPYRLDLSRPKREASDVTAIDGRVPSLQSISPPAGSSVESSHGLGCLFCIFIMVVLCLLTFYGSMLQRIKVRTYLHRIAPN